jgi:hypothetical protein
MPLTTGPGRRLARVPILLHSDPRRFIPRIEFELLRRKDPMLVFAVRSELALGSRWEAFVRNLEHLGSHRGVQFLTPTATLALQEPGHVLEPAAHAG